MPAFAILITYQDMKPKVLPGFIERTQHKYGDRFLQLNFDSGSLHRSSTGADD
jgi:hypothetical protein